MTGRVGRALTRKRNLRTGGTVWDLYRKPVITGARLKRSTRADVVIVGAGISGALIAQALTEIGLRPMILDRRRHALLGSTAASTALLQFELDTPLTALGASIGRKRAAGTWLASAAAVNDLRTAANRLGIGAHLITRPSLYLTGNRLNAAGLRREVVARQKIGLPSEFLNSQELHRHFGIGRSAALLSHGNAEANSDGIRRQWHHFFVARGKFAEVCYWREKRSSRPPFRIRITPCRCAFGHV